MNYIEPSDDFFDYYENEDGTFTVTDIFVKGVNRFEIPEGVVSLNKQVYLPDIEELNDEAREVFEPDEIVFPITLETIGDGVFCGNRRLREVYIPGNVEYIGKVAFQNCDALEKIVLGEGILEIGNGAFSYCDSLEYITIPRSVKTIGCLAFAKCRNLREIHFADPHGWHCYSYNHEKQTCHKKLFSKISANSIVNGYFMKILHRDVVLKKE